jgi:50S ribosomal subunit-associated GTPase HflX
MKLINKIDDINKGLYDSIKSGLQKENYFEISAEKGYGVDKLLNYIQMKTSLLRAGDVKI